MKYTDPTGLDINDWKDNGDGTWTVISEGAKLWDVWGADCYNVTGLTEEDARNIHVGDTFGKKTTPTPGDTSAVIQQPQQAIEQSPSIQQSNKTYQIGLGIGVFLIGAVSFEVGVCYSDKDGFDIYRSIGVGCGVGITGDITFSTNYSDLGTKSLHSSTGSTTQIGVGPLLNFDMQAEKFSGIGGIGFGGGTLWTYTRTVKGDIKDIQGLFKK